MVSVLLHLRAKPGAGDDVEKSLVGIITAARDYDGCVEIRVVREQEDPDQIVIIEKWRSRVDFESYVAERGGSSLSADVVKMLEKEPAVRFFNDAEV
jgi:quinol monooxygenase YgiN